MLLEKTLEISRTALASEAKQAISLAFGGSWDFHGENPWVFQPEICGKGWFIGIYFLLVLRRELYGNGGMGLILIVIVDHSLMPY